MPSKTSKGASSKAHNRASSASSFGKLNINAAFARNKSADKIKRNASDVQHIVGRNTSPYPHSPQPRAPLSPSKRAVVLQIETSADDDEWVSSESGAVTPADYDNEDAPPSPSPPEHAAQEEHDPPPSTTPRGDTAPPRPRPLPQSHTDLPRVNTVTKFTTHAEDSPSSDSLTHDPPTPTHTAHRRSVTRPPSMRSSHSVARPHPLIRARSHAPSTPTITAPPTLSSSVAQAYSGSTSPSPVSSPHPPGSSPRTAARSPSSESQHYPPYYPRLTRQGSHSSLASVATLPLPTTSSAATASMTHVHGERPRTLSHASTSTSAALSSLTTAARNPHVPSRPASPVLPIAFPPINPRGEHTHVMIPPPLLPAHVSATAYQNPILEALQRVTQAKAKAGR